MRSPSRYRLASRRRCHQRCRRGSAVFETIITLPLLIAGLFSIVEFSLLVNRQQHLVEATRNGALVASRLEPEILKSSLTAGVPLDVEAAVRGRLAEVDIDDVKIEFSFDRAAHALSLIHI